MELVLYLVVEIVVYCTYPDKKADLNADFLCRQSSYPLPHTKLPYFVADKTLFSLFTFKITVLWGLDNIQSLVVGSIKGKYIPELHIQDLEIFSERFKKKKKKSWRMVSYVTKYVK